MKSEDIHGITKYLIDVILSTCYNPEFKLVDIPKINVEKFIYGIFRDSVREITSSDNVIWSEKRITTTVDKIKSLPNDDEEFEYVINNWIPDMNQR